MGLSFLSSRASKREHIVAIDLGGRTTKAVHMQRRAEKFNLLNYAIVDAPAFDKTPSAEALGEHLKNVNQALGNTKTKQVTISIGFQATIFRQVEVPLLPVTDLRQMLKFNSKTYLQQDYPDHVFDCCYVAAAPGKTAEGIKPAPGPQKHKAMVGGAKRQVIEHLQEAVKSAGLIPDQFVPGLVGPVNAFEVAEPDVFAKEVVALVDIGFKESSITILDCGEMKLNRIVGLGGDQLTQGLAEAMSISYEEAEGIKVSMAAEVQANFAPLLVPLGRELRASIDFFENQQDRTVSQVFLTGGSARSEFVVQTLQTELLVPCKSWSPSRFLQMALAPEKAGEVEAVAAQLTVAIGAAASAF